MSIGRTDANLHTSSRPTILVLGTRGIPAAHGGFETFAERIALFLAGRGWKVIVYCQHEVSVVTRRIITDDWNGIERRHVNVVSTGPRATLEFDWHCVRDAATEAGVCLVLGYNSGVFLTYLRIKGCKIITNMDGIEWQRSKWGSGARAWLWANERIAAFTSHRLVADHPEIANHIATRRGRDVIATIPYGGNEIRSASEIPIRTLGLQPDNYLISIARIEPENNILTIIQAFCRQRRDAKLVVLGRLDDTVPYHREVHAAAGDEVVFPGAIYDKDTVASLRYHARAYLHGHTVGGTNPSLVEALWAGNAVIAHDNRFNRWTAGDAGLFFSALDDCEHHITRIFSDTECLDYCRRAARRQATTRFNWDDVLRAYEREALDLLAGVADQPKDQPITELTRRHTAAVASALAPRTSWAISPVLTPASPNRQE
jgi:glycosyltransferase involved in cell wall biosynthesis